jgi:hypothetical protein
MGIAMAGSQVDQDWAGRIQFGRAEGKPGPLVGEFRPSVEPELPHILDGFYTLVAAEPKLARLLPCRFDEAYRRGATGIGQVHGRTGLEPRRHVGGYSNVMRQLVGPAVRRSRWRPARPAADELGRQSDAIRREIDGFFAAIRSN